MKKLFRKPETLLNIIVEVTNGSKELQIKPSITGQELIDKIAEEYSLDPSTSCLLGLRYINSKEADVWIKSTKKIRDHDIKKEEQLKLRLSVKYYPTNFEKELRGETAKFIFCYHINSQIQSNDLYTPTAYYILLTSLALQAESGDYFHTYPGTCSPNDDHRLRTKAMMSHAEAHNTPLEQLQQDVIDCWKRYQGKSREDVLMDFLKVAKELDSYGITYFDLKTAKGTSISFGVNNEGITVYENGRRLTPKIGFVWSDISHILFNHTKVMVKVMDSKVETITANSTSTKISELLLDFCMGNHNLYLKRQRVQNALDSMNDEVTSGVSKTKLEV